MSQAKINIIGQIGRGPDEPVSAGVTLLELVPQFRAAIEAGADEIIVGWLSPGGYVDEGNAIYDYLISLKAKGIKITSTTIADPETGRGLVGSIATKGFLAGDVREVDASKDDFFIHNPWMNPGPSDSKQLFDSAEAALKAEEQLKAFYCAITNNTPEALKPFMDAETSFTGRQALDFGFATKLKNSPVALLAKVKMKDSKKSPLSKMFADFKKFVDGKLKADLTVSDAAGVSYFLDDDSITDLNQVASAAMPVPIFLANPDGTPSTTPAPDGDITTADGNVITVSGGVITNVKQSTDMEDKALAAKVAAMEQDMIAIKSGVNDLLTSLKSQGMVTASSMKSEIENAVMALKKEIGSNHTPQRTKAEKVNGQVEQLKRMGPIALKQKYGTSNLTEVLVKLGIKED